jgi:hypothetical protein
MNTEAYINAGIRANFGYTPTDLLLDTISTMNLRPRASL